MPGAGKRPPSEVDVFVVGGGACGSEVAFSLAGHRGRSIAIAERDKLGGECSHYGCVPTKVMLRSAKVAALARGAGRFGIRVGQVEVDFAAVMARARAIIEASSGQGAKPFEEQGITVLPDDVRLVGPETVEVADGHRVSARHIVLATGTEAVAPPVEGLARLPYWTNREAIWAPSSVPSSLLVLGGGPIGIEFAQLYARFGARVTVVEVAPQILPGEEPEAAAALAAVLETDGVSLVTGARASRVVRDAGDWRLELEDGRVLTAAELLVATGRSPRLTEHDLQAAGVELRDGAPVLDRTLRTTSDAIWVAGDATGELLFTHVANYEAEVVVADIAGHPFDRDYRVVPRVTYTEPEVASVGLGEQAARDAGREVVTSLASVSENARAVIEGEEPGLVKLVADARSGELLGGAVVAAGAGELVHELVAAMTGRVDPGAMGRAIHAYPTLSESLKSAFSSLPGH